MMQPEIKEFLEENLESPFSGDDVQRIISKWNEITKYFVEDRRGVAIAVLAECEGLGYDNLSMEGILVLANEYEKLVRREWFRTWQMSGVHHKHSADSPNELCDYCKESGWIKKK